MRTSGRCSKGMDGPDSEETDTGAGRYVWYLASTLEAFKAGQSTTPLTPVIRSRFDDVLSSFRRFDSTSRDSALQLGLRGHPGTEAGHVARVRQ